MTAGGGTLWIDVEDFLAYFEANPRPSGIQRLAFELKRALIEQAGSERVRFVRRATEPGRLLREVAWSHVVARFEDQQAPTTPRVKPPGVSRRSLQVQKLIQELPPHLRTPLVRAGHFQMQAARSWLEIARLVRQRLRRPAPPPAIAPTGPDRFLESVRPGDTLLVLGAPWAVPGFAALLAELKRRHGLQAHVLLYDLIPVRHPEWCTAEAVRLFESWLDASLPLFDGFMCISRHTADDVTAYARERGLCLAGPIRTIPIGTGLPPVQGDGAPSADLPAPGSYVLFVSTIEARKNHALAVRVWRHLEDQIRTGQRAPDSLPDLVFAGRVGWLVTDLLQQLDNMRWLRGRIRLIPDPTDADLRALYAGCLFTIFPSWFEGWGLPVSESLALGKPCLASSATALPEAGGALCRYFDPGSTRSALDAIAAVLDSPAALQDWQERVRREFRPTPWSETADAVLEHLGESARPRLVASS